MRRSLLLRLLVLSLSVALGSIAATAALATYGTTQQLRDQASTKGSLIETDAEILSDLQMYASGHRTWSGVDKLVRSLSKRYGRRIALTTPSGKVIADSHGSALPSNADATIDAAVLPEPPPSTTFVRNAAAEVPAETRLTSVAMAPAGESQAFTMDLTPGERAERVELADKAVECLQAKGTPAEAVVSVAGSVRALDVTGVKGIKAIGPAIGDSGGSDGSDAPDNVVQWTPVSDDPCVPVNLDAPSRRSLQINHRQTSELQSCLKGARIPFLTAEDPHKVRTVLAKKGADLESARWERCRQQATERALRGFVAPAALLYLGTSERYDAFSPEGFWRTGAMALGVLVAAALVTVLAGRRMVRPIHALTAAARRMATGDRAARVRSAGGDEVAQMGRAFNRMAESIELSERQRRAMVGDVAHELRNPLANVRGYLEAAEDGVVPLDRDLIVSLQEEARTLDRLVSDLQDLALADAGELRLHPEDCDLADLASQVVTAHATQADAAGATLSVSASEESIPAEVDPTRIRQALGNLVDNALAYTPPGGRVSIAVRPGQLAVSDTGIGIPAEHLPRVFDRFYRADPSRSRATGGSGLGLAITKHLVEAHGGTISVSSVEGEGTTFTIALPHWD